METKILVKEIKKAGGKKGIRKKDLVKILAKQNLSLDDIGLEKAESYLDVVKEFLTDKYTHTLRVEMGENNQIKILPDERIYKEIQFILNKQGYHPKIDRENATVTVAQSNENSLNISVKNIVLCIDTGLCDFDKSTLEDLDEILWNCAENETTITVREVSGPWDGVYEITLDFGEDTNLSQNIKKIKERISKSIRLIFKKRGL